MTGGTGGTSGSVESTAILAIGSNLGEREVILSEAVADLDAHPDITVTARSPLYSSVAVKLNGVDDSAPQYLNGVVAITTTLTPPQLLSVAADIEAAHGRVRIERWGDRTLDIDIIDIPGVTWDSETLTLPHPRAHERDFVLVPWLRIDPGAVLTGQGPVAELVAGLHPVAPLVEHTEVHR